MISESSVALPHAPGVGAVEMDFYPLSVGVFSLFMPPFRLCLVTLYAVFSPDLKALLCLFSKFLTSLFIHCFWFAYILVSIVTVTFSMQLLM